MRGTRRVGIFTINDYANFGNRLQNYATQEVLRSLGCQVETVVHRREGRGYPAGRPLAAKLQGFLKRNFREKTHLVRNRVVLRIFGELHQKKIAACRAFTSGLICEADTVVTDSEIPEEINARYDYFVTGSDQVWNPLLGFGTDIDFLSFAPVERRIAYAASLGVTRIPAAYVDHFRRRLQEIPHLSVREAGGAEIVRELTGREVPVLLDPTMMLDGAHWRTIARAHSAKPSEPYLLVYMLGDVPNGFWAQIRRFANCQKLKVVCLNRFREPSRYAIGPDAFIDYIQEAALLVTNSFHGAVFSILLERPFVVLRRGGMTSRIDTMLSTFQLMYRKRESLCPKEKPLEVDYSHVPSILLQERQKTTLFLQNAIFGRGLPTSQR